VIIRPGHKEIPSYATDPVEPSNNFALPCGQAPQHSAMASDCINHPVWHVRKERLSRFDVSIPVIQGKVAFLLFLLVATHKNHRPVLQTFHGVITACVLVPYTSFYLIALN
jgi:hypothetical protein